MMEFHYNSEICFQWYFCLLVNGARVLKKIALSETFGFLKFFWNQFIKTGGAEVLGDIKFIFFLAVGHHWFTPACLAVCGFLLVNRISTEPYSTIVLAKIPLRPVLSSTGVREIWEMPSAAMIDVLHACLLTWLIIIFNCLFSLECKARKSIRSDVTKDWTRAAQKNRTLY